jgi:hypothetical protein
MSDFYKYLLVHPAHGLESFQGVAYSLLLEKENADVSTVGIDYRECWSNDKLVLEWIEVESLGGNFVRFKCEDSVSVEKYLKDKLDASNLYDLLEMASDDSIHHNKLVYLVYQIGYMCLDLDDSVYAFFMRCLCDSRETIRGAAINAFMMRCWGALKTKIDELQQGDPSDYVRDVASRALIHCAG